MKKWLALLCALALLLSLGTAAFASSEEPASAEAAAEAEEGDAIQAAYAELGITGNASGEADMSVWDRVVTIINRNGLKLTCHLDSGIGLIHDPDSDYWFKDLNKNGKLDVYEDWRKSSLERAEDLAAQLPLEQMLCLMFHHEVTDELIEKGMRFELIRSYGTKTNMAGLNNEWQLKCESTEFGIPMVISTDPRHTGTINAGYVAGQDGELSQWPDTMGMAATFDPAAYERFGDVLAAEFRAMGITMLLGPQIDLITEPRWGRNNGALTEDAALNADLAQAYVSSMQTSDTFYADYGLDEGWGPESVAAVTKHWPSGGAEENGYDAHNEFGKFAVYPGDNFVPIMESFAGGSGLASDEPYTGASTQVAAVMPYYTIAMDQNPEGENVGNGFSKYIVTDLLRGTYDFGGIVMTDWMITGSDTSDTLPFTSWGLEAFKGYDVSYRYYKIITAGVDQFGGAVGLDRLYEAYDILANGSEKYGVEGVGEEAATARIRESAVRILRAMFNLGIFESAYTDPAVAEVHLPHLPAHSHALVHQRFRAGRQQRHRRHPGPPCRQPAATAYHHTGELPLWHPRRRAACVHRTELFRDIRRRQHEPSRRLQHQQPPLDCHRHGGLRRNLLHALCRQPDQLRLLGDEYHRQRVCRRQCEVLLSRLVREQLRQVPLPRRRRGEVQRLGRSGLDPRQLSHRHRHTHPDLPLQEGCQRQQR